MDRTGVAVVSRGHYVPPGKTPEPGDRALHLLIEGTDALSVRQAKLDIMRMLEEETLRIRSAMGSGGGGGRYSVV